MPQPTEATHQSGRVVNFAQNQLGKPFRLGATGLRRYDCSGLVYRAFREGGMLSRIGGDRKRARGYFRWFRDRGMLRATAANARPGDLVFYRFSGRPVTHMGIYLRRNANGKHIVISALTTGVARHRMRAINVPFVAVGRVKWHQ